MIEQENTQTLGAGSRVKHPAYGDGVIMKLELDKYQVCFMLYGLKEMSKTYNKWEIVERIAPEGEVDFSKMEKSLIKILRTWSDVNEVVTIDKKWEGGTLVFKPGRADLKSKEMPINGFFHKIVMLRDRLRVMEQRINSSKNLSDDEKVNLQQYITRSYGSLTSFNILFKHKADHFKGATTKK